MLRVTIRELLLLTAFFAVGLAALKCANDVLVRVSWNGIILCLLIAWWWRSQTEAGARQLQAALLPAWQSIWYYLCPIRSCQMIGGIG